MSSYNVLLAVKEIRSSTKGSPRQRKSGWKEKCPCQLSPAQARRQHGSKRVADTESLGT